MQVSTAVDRLVLARELPHLGIDGKDPSVRLMTDPAVFQREMRHLRPVVVIVCSPPATAADLEAVSLERRRRSDMRAMLLTRVDAISERLTALRGGFDEALDVTVEPRELAGRLALLAEQARAARIKNRIPISPAVAIDLDAHALRVRGRAVHLRPREFALLEVLARNPGQTFSRERLLQAVGARPTIRDLRTIDVHIRWLRAKLDHEAPGVASLVTVRGVGYRLDRGRDGGAGIVNKALTERQRVVDAPLED